MESQLEKIHTCDNVHAVQTESFTSKRIKHMVRSYSLFTPCSFDNNKSKHDF